MQKAGISADTTNLNDRIFDSLAKNGNSLGTLGDSSSKPVAQKRSRSQNQEDKSGKIREKNNNFKRNLARNDKGSKL